uniref:Uncharacterized protein n=1 Tax=Trichogramma kaykai TaxID=54128 RepID=A0ABD2WA61_9HYME
MRGLTRSRANEIIFEIKKDPGRHSQFCLVGVNLFSHTSSFWRGSHAESLDAYTQAYGGNDQNISANVILKTIENVITNAKDWDGNRIKRMKHN